MKDALFSLIVLCLPISHVAITCKSNGINNGPSLGLSSVSISLSDIDGDGDLDLTVARDDCDDLVYMAENLGGGIFRTSYTPLGERQQTGRISKASADHDLNGDGFNDLIVCERLSSPYPGQEQQGAILISFNDESGNFAPPVAVLPARNIEGTSRTYQRVFCRDMAIADTNKDGHNDIIVTASNLPRAILGCSSTSRTMEMVTLNSL